MGRDAKILLAILVFLTAVIINGVVKGMNYHPDPITVQVIETRVDRQAVAAECTRQTEAGCARYEAGVVTVYNVETNRGSFTAPYDVFSGLEPGKLYELEVSGDLINRVKTIEAGE